MGYVWGISCQIAEHFSYLQVSGLLSLSQIYIIEIVIYFYE